LLLAFVNAVILGYEFIETRDHILLSRFEASLFVTFYDWQGYRGGILPCLHTGRLIILNGTLLYNHFARTEYKLSFSTVPLLLLAYALPWKPVYLVVA
jgi:hypothetical protein